MIPYPDEVAVVGASGRSGAALCRALTARGRAYRPVVRDAAKWRALGLPGAACVADLGDAATLAGALAGAGLVVSCAHARHTAGILAATPPATRHVLIGSTRRYSRWADAHGDGVRAGEAAWAGSGRRGVMLHPTMIYGAEGEDNVRRLARLLRRLPVVPLPGGGRALVQPIHQDDLTACLLAAMARDWPASEVVAVAGPVPLPYREFVCAVALAAGLPAPRIVGVPLWPLLAASPLTAILPGMPRVRTAELRRLQEDKAVSIERMRFLLGVEPRALADGLRLAFGREGAPVAGRG